VEGGSVRFCDDTHEGEKDVTDTTPAGWYPAPHAGGELRYWDGTAWHAAPAYLPTGPSATPGIPSPTPSGSVLPPYASGAPAMPPGYPAYAGGPVPTSRPIALGVTALSLGIAAVLVSWIPFLGLVVAVLGAVFGVIALVRRQPKGLAVTGAVLSGVGLILACLATFTVLSYFWSDSPTRGYSSEDDGGALPEDPATPAVPDLEPYAPEAGPGSISDPLPLPYVRESSLGTEYSAEVRLVDEDATEEVLSWNPINVVPDGYRYVLAEMTVTSMDPDGLPAAFPTYDLSLATEDGSVYPYSFVIAEDDTTLLRDAGTIAEGETATGLVTYLVPEDATDFLLTDLAGYYSF